jgi:RNA polymerase sigma-70 factor, ECF subfamily
VIVSPMDFQCLYEKYAPEVRRFALFLCGDRALADDITSDTFLRVWLARGRIRELTVKSYLFAVARNAYRDLQRRAWRSEALDGLDADPGTGVHELLEQKEELSAVLAGLQDLPETDRAALLMRSLDEMPYEEIAVALKITVTAARVKVHRSRVRLMAARNPIREKLGALEDRR